MIPKYRRMLRLCALGLGLTPLLLARWQAGEVLDATMHHLGNDVITDWPEAPAQPEGMQLEFAFQARANQSEVVLSTWSRNVDDEWTLQINGESLGALKRGAELQEAFYPIPPGLLREGTNQFALRTRSKGDDITFGRVRLIQETFRELFQLGVLFVSVNDAETQTPIPARITIADAQGNLIPIYYTDAEHAAARPGVLYTDAGFASCELAAGSYTVYSSRGAEWGMDQAQVTIGPEPTKVRLAIRREVDTRGFIAADTHIHTLTYSGHGDSSVEERVITLAGEGVELAIATDHNHNTEYAGTQARLGLQRYFTPVVGNEVTTSVGHFNAFPLDAKDAIPPYESKDFVELVAGMREKGAKVVILNHPRWPNHEEGPFGVIDLNPFTGEGLGDAKYPFDAMELINSCTEENEPMLLFRDWFSLLNRGEHVVAVGSSDSHTVGEPVGGGRTYVPSASDDPTQIDVDQACAAIAKGRTSISMGIFATASAIANGQTLAATMGQQLTAVAGCELRVRVQAPGWVHPTTATLFVNGSVVHEVPLAALAGTFDQVFTYPLANRFHQDAWAVWVIQGTKDPAPFWPLANPYTLGATNPIYLDFDGDGAYAAPRATAWRLMAEVESDPDRLVETVKRCDEAVAFHLLDFAGERYRRDAEAKLREAAAKTIETHPAIDEYLKRRP